MLRAKIHVDLCRLGLVARRFNFQNVASRGYSHEAELPSVTGDGFLQAVSSSVAKPDGCVTYPLVGGIGINHSRHRGGGNCGRPCEVQREIQHEREGHHGQAVRNRVKASHKASPGESGMRFYTLTDKESRENRRTTNVELILGRASPGGCAGSFPLRLRCAIWRLPRDCRQSGLLERTNRDTPQGVCSAENPEGGEVR